MQFGDYRVEIIPDTEFRLDGGAMFGVVPRTLWSTVFPPDDHNRIRMNMNCVYIEGNGERILIETGIGEKWSPKHREIYGITRERSLADSLRTIARVEPEDITIVINTHLHFDHAGGNTRVGEGGKVEISFLNATYIVKRGEYDYALHANERTAASYFDRNYAPLEAADKIEWVTREKAIVKGIRVVPTPGHTPFHQSVLIESGGERAFYLGDLCPTHAHLPLPWIMGYDVEPLVTLETKRRILKQAVDENWLLIFEHDATVAWGRVEHDGKAYRLTPGS